MVSIQIKNGDMYMQTKLKRKLLLPISLSFLIIILVILITIDRQPKLYTELIINTQNNVDLSDISLFYTDVDYNNIKSYYLTPTGLNEHKVNYIPYSEGFMEKNTFKSYKKLLEANGMSLTSSFQTYYETDEFVFFAFPGDLTSFRILEKATNKVYPPKFSSNTYISPMYVSHMVVVDNKLIILAGEARSYHGLVYVINLATGEVSHSKRLETHPSALDASHYTLTSDGKALWIAGEALQVYDPLKDEEATYPMPYTLTGVTSDKETIWAYNMMADELKGVLLNTHSLSSTPTSISLTLPTTTCKLVDLSLQDSTLALALYDEEASHFKQYIVLYDLNTHTMTYCLGIGDTSPLILADIDFTH